MRADLKVGTTYAAIATAYGVAVMLRSAGLQASLHAATIPHVHRFYAPDFPASGEVYLPDDEAQHLARVLRLQPGDSVAIFDGQGREALARVAVYFAAACQRPRE